MSYSDLVTSFSPNYYFRAEETAWPVVNAGSTNISSNLVQQTTDSAKFTFNQSGGIVGKCWYLDTGTTGAAFYHTDNTSIFDTGTWTISAWTKISSTANTDHTITAISTGSPNYGYLSFQITKYTNGTRLIAYVNGVERTSGYINKLVDGSWHHVAWSANGNAWKLYVDGTVVFSGTGTSTASSGFDAKSQGWGGVAGSTNAYFNGYLDEMAVFPSVLTDTNIIDLASYPGSVTVTADVKTASGLLTTPTIQTNAINTVSAFTANAASGDHFVSTYDVYTSLDTYLDGMTLEERLKFDSKAEKTIGTNASNIPLEYYGSESYYGIGPSGSGALRVGSYTNNGYSRIGLSDGLSDRDFVLGIWFKLNSASPTDGIKKFIMSTAPRAGGTNAIMDISHTDGEITFDYKTSAHTRTHTTTADYRDNEWHFAAIKDDGSDIKFFLDGTQVHTQALGGTRSNVVGLFLGTVSTLDQGASGDSTNIYIGGFFITSTANCSNGTLATIYAAGNHIVQAGGLMNDATVKFNNALDNLTESLGARADIRFNENVGALANFGLDTDYAVLFESEEVVKNIPSKNKSAYSYQDPGYFTETTFNYIDLEADTATHVVVAKFAAPETGENHVFTASIGDFDTTMGVLFGYDEDGPWAGMSDNSFDLANVDLIHSNDTSYFDKWNMFTVTKDETTIKFYINGHLIGTTTTAIVSSPFGETTFGGVENYFFGGASTTLDIFIDEYKVFNYAMTAQQQFEYWQTMQIDGWTPAESLLVNPTLITGTGQEFVVLDTFAASADFPDVIEFDEIIPEILPMTAFADMGSTNFGTTSNAVIEETPMTASSTMVDSQFNIGENNLLEHFSASALFPEAYARIQGTWNAAPMIATDATFVDPEIVTITGALVEAAAMTARGFMKQPTNYFNLFDDLWYSLLFKQHSQPNNERGTNNIVSAYSFLKLFNDVTSDLTGLNTDKIINNLPVYIVKDSPSNQETDITYINTQNRFLTASPAPLLERGYDDPFGRAAVRFKNIEFPLPEDRTHATNQYSVEFTFKTDKANQIIAKSISAQENALAYKRQTIGLLDGKLYGMSAFQELFKENRIVHPDNYSYYNDLKLQPALLIGSKRVDDGLWHHIIIQSGLDGRTQIWIDGELDIQSFHDATGYGKAGYGFLLRPFIIGANDLTSKYQSDFETSAWSYDAGKFIDSTEIVTHYAASFNYEPIKAEPMVASATITQNTTGIGNRGRALMLYWWPTTTGQSPTVIAENWNKYPNGTSDPTDVNTMDPAIETADYIYDNPQEYYGWDIFPVDVTGYFVSDLVKPEAYGEENITTYNYYRWNTSPGVNDPRNVSKINRRGTFRDAKTDSPRYLDVLNDIDLSKFDAIFFRNYPDQSQELEQFAQNQPVDIYFGTKEVTIYENFVKSLRAAVDTGISLFITNYKLALDLGIIDRVEIVPDLGESGSDTYSPTLVPEGVNTSVYPVRGVSGWADTYRNNRQRIVNLVPGITDQPTIIKTDYAAWTPDGMFDFGKPGSIWKKFIYKPQGLAVGDEYILTDYLSSEGPKQYVGIPFENVKAGTIVTAFANTYRNGTSINNNPYKDYATTIVLQPGDVLDGQQVGGKIFVNLTENKYNLDVDEIDLVTDYWINFAFDQDAITEEQKNAYISATWNLDRQLEAGQLTQQEYNERAFWSLHGNYILTQSDSIYDATQKGEAKEASKDKKSVKRFNARGNVVNGSQSFGGLQYFTFKYAREFPTFAVEVPHILTRGFWFISERFEVAGEVQRPLAVTAQAEFPMPVVTADRDTESTVQVMLGSATITETEYKGPDINIVSLPMFADALMMDRATIIESAAMIANATMGTDYNVLTSSIDEVILYVKHTDPILYLREEIIK